MTTLPNTLLLITADPSQPLAQSALRYAQAFLAQASISQADDKAEVDKDKIAQDHHYSLPLRVFFYGDAANIANALRWQSAEQLNITRQWQLLAQQFQLSLPVCVSTALARGITDQDNARRHSLADSLAEPVSMPAIESENLAQTTPSKIMPSNIASGFELVGLGELAALMSEAQRVIQF